MTRPIWFLLTSVAMATLTWVVGWWMVPVVAAILTLVRRDDAAAPLHLAEQEQGLRITACRQPNDDCRRFVIASGVRQGNRLL